MNKDQFESISLKKYAEESYLNYAMYVILIELYQMLAMASSLFREEFCMQCQSSDLMHLQNIKNQQEL